MVHDVAPAPAVRARTSLSIANRLKTDPVFQSFWLLRIGFTALPIAFPAYAAPLALLHAPRT